MTTDDMSDRMTSENLAPEGIQGSSSRETAHGVPEPHFPSSSPRVLARMPDLEWADSEAGEKHPATSRGGRILGSRPSVLILASGGALLLLSALGLPFLWSDSKSPEATSSEESPALRPVVPHGLFGSTSGPDDALSSPSSTTGDLQYFPPSQDFKLAKEPSEESSTWQAPGERAGSVQPDVTTVPGGQGGSLSAEWPAPPQPYAPGDPLHASAWPEVSQGQSPTLQPERAAWGKTGDMVRGGSQPPWQSPPNQTGSPGWDARPDVAADGYLSGQRPSASGDRLPTSSGGQDQRPAWELPEDRFARRFQPGPAAPADTAQWSSPAPNVPRQFPGQSAPNVSDGSAIVQGGPGFQPERERHGQDPYATGRQTATGPIPTERGFENSTMRPLGDAGGGQNAWSGNYSPDTASFRLGSSSNDMPSPYDGRNDASRPAFNTPYPYPPPDSYPSSSQPFQVDSNRAMTIGDNSPAGTFDSRSTLRNGQPRSATADALTGAAGSQLENYPETYRGTLPDGRYPQAGTLPTTYPPANYSGAHLPGAEGSTDRYGTDGYPTSRYPSTTYPSAGRGGSDYSIADRRAADSPLTPPPTGASTPLYGTGGYPPYTEEPGVARFQGGIERPSGSYLDDRNRSGLY